MMAFIGLCIVWASFGRLDVVASAQGKIIPEARVKLLQSADGGVVRAIHVRDGQSVKAGQILMELDPTQSGADAAQAQSALQTARVDKARADAMLSYLRTGRPSLVSPIGTSAAMGQIQITLTRSQIAEFEAKIADLNEREAEMRAMANMAEQERAKLQATLPLLKERVARRKELTEKGLSSGLLQLELEQQQVGHERDIGVQAMSAQRYRASLASIGMQKAEARQAFAREAATLLAKATDEIALRTEELTKADQKSRLQQLKSPVSGTVQQVAVHTLGAVVKPADPLLVVVPAGGTLVVDAQVLNRDVGQLKIGQDVAVKLEAFPFTRYGTVPGTLVQLSRDAIQDEKLGLIYAAKIRLTCPGMNNNDASKSSAAQASEMKQSSERRTVASMGQSTNSNTSLLCPQLAPGMAATVDIRTGTRSIMEFLLSPLARRAQEAGRER
jgi:hemolysin D